MKKISKILFTLAAVWSVIAGLLIFFTFGGTSVSATSGSETQQISHISWFEWAGWWGIAILFIFALLFYGVLHFHRRGRMLWTVVFGVVTITLSVLAGFSIGTVYWPGSAAVLLGLLVLPFRQKNIP